MDFILNLLNHGFFAAIAGMGFAIGANPPIRLALMASGLATIGFMVRYSLIAAGIGIATASLCAALVISLCSIPCSKRLHIPAEMFSFPALLPMIPGMFAYRTILATMKFLGATAMSSREAYLVEIVYNGLTTFFIMWALVIGAVLPLFLLQRTSPLRRGILGFKRKNDRYYSDNFDHAHDEET